MEIEYGVVKDVKRFDVVGDDGHVSEYAYGEYVEYLEWLELKEAYELLAAEHEGPES